MPEPWQNQSLVQARTIAKSCLSHARTTAKPGPSHARTMAKPGLSHARSIQNHAIASKHYSNEGSQDGSKQASRSGPYGADEFWYGNWIGSSYVFPMGRSRGGGEVVAGRGLRRLIEFAFLVFLISRFFYIGLYHHKNY